MPLPMTAVLKHGKTATAPVNLKFMNHEILLSQARFSGRTMLTPDIELKDYSFRAVIDWIEFQISFGKTTQFRFVQEVLRKHLGRTCLVTPVDPGEGNESDTFTIKIQEPKSGKEVSYLCDALFAHFGKSSDATIRGLEVSLDAKPRKPSDKARHLAVGVLQRTIFSTRDIWTKPASRPRSNKGRASSGQVTQDNRKLLVESRRGNEEEGYLLPENHFAPWIDGTMYLGAKDDDVMIRIMDKVIDQQNPEEGTWIDLPDTEMRARIEVTLKGEELRVLGLRRISDLRGFAFTKLQGRYFQFKLPTFRTAPNGKAPVFTLINEKTQCRRAEIFLKTGVVGLRARDVASRDYRTSMIDDLRRLCRQRGRPISIRQGGSGETGLFVAYDRLNRFAATALRQLGEREATAWK